MSAPSLRVSVWRGAGTGEQGAGKYQTFDVPVQESQTVLDLVAWIQQNADPTLAYRYACRVGMCGSCAMTVNGVPRWTCRTHIDRVAQDGAVTIGPLRNLPVIRDLVADMDPFFDKWIEAGGAFAPTRTRADAVEPIDPATPARRAVDAAIECINCGVCYAACDVVSANPDYLGPAALNRAWSLVNDVKDGALDARLTAVSGPGGCHNCHSQQGCVAHCPNDLNPTAAIAGLKRATVRAALRGKL